MTTPQQLDERYGRSRHGRAPWIIGGVIAVLLVGWLSWITVANSMNSVTADDLGFEVVDAHEVTVHYQVTAPRGRDVYCVVQALDKEFGIVGWKIERIAASDAHTRRFTATVPTVAEATTGLVNTCQVT